MIIVFNSLQIYEDYFICHHACPIFYAFLLLVYPVEACIGFRCLKRLVSCPLLMRFGIGSVLPDDRADTGQRWRTSRVKMAYIPGCCEKAVCPGVQHAVYDAVSKRVLYIFLFIFCV